LAVTFTGSIQQKPVKNFGEKGEWDTAYDVPQRIAVDRLWNNRGEQEKRRRSPLDYCEFRKFL